MQSQYNERKDAICICHGISFYRYEALKETLDEASALDARFKTLPVLSQEARDDTFARLTAILTKAARLKQVDASDVS